MEAELFLLVGLPGSGKSTWAQQNKGKLFDKVLSSDDYRVFLYGDVNDQTHNKEVFEALHNDMIEYLNNGVSICLDATHINRKSRAKIFNLLEQKKVKCKKTVVFFATDPGLVIAQNYNRSRVVPTEVIEKMLRNFEIPFEGEGFDELKIIWETVPAHGFDLYTDGLRLMMGVDQDNPHHTLDLYNHCAKCYEQVITKSNDVNLIFAALFHDIGKLYTKTYNSEKGYSQYIGHQNYGAYLSLFYDYKPFEINPYKLAFYINYHMEPFRLKDAKEFKKERTINQFGKEWDNILVLHKADKDAH